MAVNRLRPATRISCASEPRCCPRRSRMVAARRRPRKGLENRSGSVSSKRRSDVQRHGRFPPARRPMAELCSRARERHTPTSRRYAPPHDVRQLTQARCRFHAPVARIRGFRELANPLVLARSRCFIGHRHTARPGRSVTRAHAGSRIRYLREHECRSRRGRAEEPAPCHQQDARSSNREPGSHASGGLAERRRRWTTAVRAAPVVTESQTSTVAGSEVSTLLSHGVAQARPGRRRAPGVDGGCFVKVTDRKLFVIERQEHHPAPRQISLADPAEALRSSPDASLFRWPPSRCCLAPIPLVCETASTTAGSAQS